MYKPIILYIVLYILIYALLSIITHFFTFLNEILLYSSPCKKTIFAFYQLFSFFRHFTLLSTSDRSVLPSVITTAQVAAPTYTWYFLRIQNQYTTKLQWLLCSIRIFFLFKPILHTGTILIWNRYITISRFVM